MAEKGRCAWVEPAFSNVAVGLTLSCVGDTGPAVGFLVLVLFLPLY